MQCDFLGLEVPAEVHLPRSEQLQRVVHHTAQFIFQHGPRLEALVLGRQRELGSRKVEFLDPQNPYHSYYQYLLSSLRALRARGELQLATAEYLQRLGPCFPEVPPAASGTDLSSQPYPDLTLAGTGNPPSSPTSPEVLDPEE
eukprot:RCo037938